MCTRILAKLEDFVLIDTLYVSGVQHMVSNQFLPKNSFFILLALFRLVLAIAKHPIMGITQISNCIQSDLVLVTSARIDALMRLSAWYFTHMERWTPQKLHNQRVVRDQSSRKLNNTQFRQILVMYQCVTLFLHESSWNSRSDSRSRHARKPLGLHVVSYPPTPVGRRHQKQAFLRVCRYQRFVTTKTSRKWAEKEQAIRKINSTPKTERESYAWCLKWTNSRTERSSQSWESLGLTHLGIIMTQLWGLRSIRVCPFHASSICFPFNFPRRIHFPYRLLFFCSFTASFLLSQNAEICKARRNACFWSHLATGVGGYDTTYGPSGFLACLFLETDMLFQKLSCRKMVTHWYISKICRNCVFSNFLELWAFTTIWLWSFCGSTFPCGWNVTLVST